MNDSSDEWAALMTTLAELDRSLETGQAPPPERDELDGRLTRSIRKALKTNARAELGPDAVAEVASSSTAALRKLAGHIKIDSRIYYNPRELERTADLIQNQIESTRILDRNIRLVSSLTDLLETVFENQTGDEDESQLQSCFECRCEMIYRLACWCSVGYSNDEWDLDPELRKIIDTTIDRLWRMPYSVNKVPVRGWNIDLEIAYIVLNTQIKPLFTAQKTFSRHVNPATGRKIERKEEHLLGPSSDSLDEPAWKLEGIGLWNAMCIVLDRLHHDPGLKEIWPLLIPPIVTLVESTMPHYRLRGIQLSICLLRNVQPLLICQTGINSILQNAFSTTFSLLNIQQTYALLDAAFEATRLLIDVEWRASRQTARDQAARYLHLNRLIEQAIFNALTFGKGQGQPGQVELHLFAVSRFIEITRDLGYGIGRYIRVILPYLCETLLSLTLSRSSYLVVIEINKLLQLLFAMCADLLVEWRSRLVAVYATCWLEWRRAGADEADGPGHVLSEPEVEAVRQSTIEDTLKSFVKPDHASGDERSGGSNQEEGQRQEELLKMIKTVRETDPLLDELFGPLFVSS
ncbi:hypothetical protein PTTG_03939 [Puccinia triticina 1-1 BBBD Race 1]|uniref:Uncharacterized protein n=1 Tax=Puccinia triticina (isolate 1-1 / race 1 (BBBD)) TaxID=630390 RepID=A0A180GHS0_PUCT1|nr:hypothetical protein PTTG_03939 [Puccinia triticina 1-1 BBBD Race 1]WAR62386.1 hypothetical protein PtB15_14B481 [Puccinia triticina]